MKRTVGHWWIRCTRCGHGERLLGDLVPVGQPDVLFMYVCRDRAGCQEREAAVRRNYYVASEGQHEDGLIRVIVEREQRRFPGRVTGASVPHERHAMTNDIYLNAALVMQGLHDIDALSGGTGKP
jgi:hypothetical protein